MQLACSGASRRDILQFVATQTTWGVSVRTIDRYMADAHVAVVDAGRHNHELELGRAKVRLNLLFGRALAAKDYSTALAVQREINRLLNLLPAPEEASNRRGGEIPAEFTLVLGEGEVKADASVEDVPELEALTPAAALSAPALTPEVTASRDAAEDLDHAGEVL